jgi:hypothetical protein
MLMPEPTQFEHICLGKHKRTSLFGPWNQVKKKKSVVASTTSVNVIKKIYLSVTKGKSKPECSSFKNLFSAGSRIWE